MLKKSVFSVLLLITMLTLVSCSSEDTASESKVLSEDGIAPYELSESDTYLLQCFGMDKNSQIISFRAPKGTNNIAIKISRLNDAGDWESITDSGMGFSEEESAEQLTGTFALQLEENCVIKYKIICGGTASFKTDPIVLAGDSVISAHSFLSKFQSIELNKEIPVALMVYDSGTVMPAFSLNDYFEPSRFEGMDLVQAVTLKFSYNPMG